MSPDDPNAATSWHEYLRNWTAANHVRTASCVVAAVLLLGSLSGRHAETSTDPVSGTAGTRVVGPDPHRAAPQRSGAVPSTPV